MKPKRLPDKCARLLLKAAGGDKKAFREVYVELHQAVRDYLASLDKVSALDVSLVLPGHRQVFEDFQGRIAELEHHHQVSAEEVLAILATGSKTSYEVASEMTWHIAAATWDAFPVIQKWFATGEATAHLRYLEERGAVRHAMRNGTALFSRCRRRSNLRHGPGEQIPVPKRPKKLPVVVKPTSGRGGFP